MVQSAEATPLKGVGWRFESSLGHSLAAGTLGIRVGPTLIFIVPDKPAPVAQLDRAVPS